jgi:hypothetical protein
MKFSLFIKAFAAISFAYCLPYFQKYTRKIDAKLPSDVMQDMIEQEKNWLLLQQCCCS